MSRPHPSWWARVAPDRDAYIVANTDRHVTFAELEARSNQYAHLFRECGLKPGDHIALQLENSEHFCQVTWGAQRSGLIYTPIHSHLKRDEVEYILDNCNARLFIASGKLRDTATSLRREKIPVEHFFMLNGEAPGFTDLLAAVARQPTTPIADQAAGAHMMYSSGTTGKPKGILPDWIPERFDDMPEMLLAGSKAWGFGPGEVYLTPAPLYHAAGMVTAM